MVRRPHALVAVFAALFAVALACGTCGGPKPSTTQGKGDPEPPAEPKRAQFHLFAFARVLGTIAPCGCTTEPLGGLQYAFGYIGSRGPTLSSVVLEPGSLLFPADGSADWPTDEASWDQARDRAAMLQKRFGAIGGTLVSGVGPTDVASPQGAAALETLAMPRVVANVTFKHTPATSRFKVVELRDEGISYKVGITAVVDPTLKGAEALGQVVPPAPALTEAVAAMRKSGAELTVVLAHGDRGFTEGVVKAVDDIDIAVVAVVDGVDKSRLGTPAATVGGAYILEPGQQMQTMTELTLDIDAATGKVPPPPQWTVVPPRSQVEQELTRVEQRIAKFNGDAAADPAFIKRLETERERLKAALAGGAVKGAAVATFDQVKVTCKLPADDGAKTELKAYDARVAAANEARFRGVKPPAPKRGTSGYAGIDACNDCHEEAVAHWKTTVHAKAYETLVDDNKQFDLSCVSCHVTGFRRPGGSEVVENGGLRAVQCESCHGPGSRHVEDGGDNLGLIALETPEQLCATECHTPEHSDTFEYEAYLRDILGPGHGDAARKKLGDGPTGAQLRAAGLAKAGGACPKP